MKTKMEFRNSADKAELKIYDNIEKFWGFDTEQLEEKLEEAAGKPLNVYINSYGGEVFEGFAIYNILKRYSGRKTVYVDGVAASIASLIALSGDHIVMHKASMIMIHNASGACFGTAEDMEKTAAALHQINQILKDVYEQRTNLTEDQITDFMNQEKFFTAEECLQYGFADEIDEEAADEKQTPTAFDLLKASVEERIAVYNQVKKAESFLDQNRSSDQKEEKPEQKDLKQSAFLLRNKAIEKWLKGER